MTKAGVRGRGMFSSFVSTTRCLVGRGCAGGSGVTVMNNSGNNLLMNTYVARHPSLFHMTVPRMNIVSVLHCRGFAVN